MTRSRRSSSSTRPTSPTPRCSTGSVGTRSTASPCRRAPAPVSTPCASYRARAAAPRHRGRRRSCPTTAATSSRRIHEEGEILESEHVADGTRMRAKVTPVIEADLAAYTVVAQLTTAPGGLARAPSGRPPTAPGGRASRIRGADPRIGGRALSHDSRQDVGMAPEIPWRAPSGSSCAVRPSPTSTTTVACTATPGRMPTRRAACRAPSGCRERLEEDVADWARDELGMPP